VPACYTLLDVLRRKLRLTGTKEGCGEGECGACTVIMNGRPVSSCIIMASQADGADIVTVEGLSGKDGSLHPVQEAFIEEGGVQCGFCTPGLLIASKAMLDKNLNCDEKEAKAALAGNLCRCTGYKKIFKAVDKAKVIYKKSRNNGNR